MGRSPIVFGNWKMNLRREQARKLVKETVQYLERETPELDAGVCPPALYLEGIQKTAEQTDLHVGAQNCHWEKEGAFTGEISPYMITDIGCDWVIIGHSERRHVFGETAEEINQKLHAAAEAGLNIIYCIGETEDQRDENLTRETVVRQLQEGLTGLDLPFSDRELVVAYEPVWAIGTGNTARPEQAQEVHEWIREWFSEQHDEETADRLRIQYGGSVKPHNVAEIIGQPDIDGALVGSASLTPSSFIELLQNSLI